MVNVEMRIRFVKVCNNFINYYSDMIFIALNLYRMQILSTSVNCHFSDPGMTICGFSLRLRPELPLAIVSTYINNYKLPVAIMLYCVIDILIL